MGFTCTCAVRKSTPPIWRSLTGMGLKRTPFYPNLKESTRDEKLCTIAENGVFYNQSFIGEGVIDCGDDTELFFALAALRDDTDIFQWFIYDDRDHEEANPRRFWFRCATDRIEDDMTGGKWSDCAKARPQEIIYHFAHPEDDKTIY